MATHRIVCTTQEPAGAPPSHAHIVQVGIGSDPNKATHRLTLDQVIAMIDQGEVFYTYGETSKKTALVTKARCSHCSRWIIKSAPDAVRDNNLDSLRYCNWSAAA